MVQIRLDLPEALHRQLTAQAHDIGESLESFLLALLEEQSEAEIDDERPMSQQGTSLFRFQDDPLRPIQERYLASIAELQPQIISIQEKVLVYQYQAVRGSLEVVAQLGLPGNHHFLFVFSTRAAGVEIPDFLRARFPETMKIVLQNQFSQLEVEPDLFSVVLWFGGEAHRLTIPFSSLLAFSDPTVGLQMAFPPPSETVDEAPEEPPPTSTEGPVDNVVEMSAFRKK